MKGGESEERGDWELERATHQHKCSQMFHSLDDDSLATADGRNGSEHLPCEAHVRSMYNCASHGIAVLAFSGQVGGSK